jgi:hypothetical protein
MEGNNTYELFTIGFSHEKNKSKSLRGRSKYKGKYKYSRKFFKVCSRCENEWHYKKKCISKSVEIGKGFDDAPATKKKSLCNWIFQEGGDV